jgi:hypothetical protein
MTHHIAHTNAMIFNLKKEHRNKIDYLQMQIVRQKNEIDILKRQILILTEGKKYDC